MSVTLVILCDRMLVWYIFDGILGGMRVVVCLQYRSPGWSTAYVPNGNSTLAMLPSLYMS